jgi:hypothetical protein
MIMLLMPEPIDEYCFTEESKREDYAKKRDPAVILSQTSKHISSDHEKLGKLKD